jgi:hypothetical protein
MTGTSATGGEEVNCSIAEVVAAVTTVATAAGVVVVMTAGEYVANGDVTGKWFATTGTQHCCC